jgi:CRP-like cAMP-binding protein
MHNAAATTTVRTLIARSPLFEQVDAATLDRACAGAIERRIEAGAVLFRQGEMPERLHLVTEGRLKMTRVTPDGSQLTIGILGPEEMAGCVAVFRKIPYPATATSMSPLATLSWTRAQFEQMLKDSAQLGRNVVKIVGERAERFLGRVQELTSDASHQRVARALLRMLAGGESKAPDRTHGQTVLTTRQELADLSDVTLHTASRVVAALERKGIVQGGRKKIVVAKPDALRVIAERKNTSPPA